MKFTTLFTSALLTIALSLPQPGEELKPKTFSNHDLPHTRLPPSVGHGFTREVVDFTDMLADSTQLDEFHRRTRIPRAFGPSGKTSHPSDLPTGPTQLVQLEEKHHRFSRRPRTVRPREGEASDFSDLPVEATQPVELHRFTRRPRTVPPRTGEASDSTDLPVEVTQPLELHRFSRRTRTLPPGKAEASDSTVLPVEATQPIELHRFSRRPRTIPPRTGEASDSSDLPVEATQPVEVHRFTRPPRTVPPREGDASDSSDPAVDATQPIELHRFSRRPRTIPPMQQVSDFFADRIKITFGSLKEKLPWRTRSQRPTLPPVVAPLTDATQFAPNQAVVVSVVPQGHTSDAPDATVETVSVAA